MRQSKLTSVTFVLNSYAIFLVVYLLMRGLFGSQWWWLGLLNTFAFWLFVPLLLLLPIISLLRMRRVSALALLLVGIALWQFAPIQLNTQSDQPHDLRVLTHNIWAINETVDEAVDWILAQDADIIILQELIGPHQDHIPEIVASHPHRVYVEGNVQLFSRHPFLESGVIWLVESSDQNYGRPAVRAVVDVDGQAVAVYGVHLSLPISDVPNIPIVTPFDSLNAVLRYNEAFRNQQLDGLRALVEAETIPVIVAGDFNTSHSSPVLYDFSDGLLQNSFAEAGQGVGLSWYHAELDFPVLWIDYIWFSSEFSALRSSYGEAFGSDHLPVVSDFSFIR